MIQKTEPDNVGPDEGHGVGESGCAVDESLGNGAISFSSAPDRDHSINRSCKILELASLQL